MKSKLNKCYIFILAHSKLEVVNDEQQYAEKASVQFLLQPKCVPFVLERTLSAAQPYSLLWCQSPNPQGGGPVPILSLQAASQHSRK